MSDIAPAVITGFVSAFTTFLSVVVFTGRQIGDAKSELRAEIREVKADLTGEIGGLRTEVRSDLHRLDEKFDRIMFELLRHIREGGHQPPPQAA